MEFELECRCRLLGSTAEGAKTRAVGSSEVYEEEEKRKSESTNGAEAEEEEEDTDEEEWIDCMC